MTPADKRRFWEYIKQHSTVQVALVRVLHKAFGEIHWLPIRQIKTPSRSMAGFIRIINVLGKYLPTRRLLMSYIINNQPNQSSNIFYINRTCSNCRIMFKPIEHDYLCPACRSWHYKYLDYLDMKRGIESCR